jgi:cation diffusion facilitator CzcD-associated flavoprotein CzcO
MTGPNTKNTHEHVDVLVAGAGLAGLYILYCLRHAG